LGIFASPERQVRSLPATSEKRNADRPSEPSQVDLLLAQQVCQEIAPCESQQRKSPVIHSPSKSFESTPDD
jgi:hypothetical protein